MFHNLIYIYYMHYILFIIYNIYIYIYSPNIYSFGGHVDDYPHPGVDAKGFMKVINARNKKEPKVWNPTTQRMTSWVDPSKIKGIVGSKCNIS